MGMFDEFHFIGESSKKVCCAAGHPQTGGLQTKDLDCHMTQYYVFMDQVFEHNGIMADTEDHEQTQSIVNGVLVITSTSRYKKAKTIDGRVNCYRSCEQCEPVYHEGKGAWQGNLATAQPWCDWVLTIRDGALISVDSGRCETRDQVREKLGGTAIPDDDRVVKKELEKWRSAHQQAPK